MTWQQDMRDGGWTEGKREVPHSAGCAVTSQPLLLEHLMAVGLEFTRLALKGAATLLTCIDILPNSVQL